MALQVRAGTYPHLPACAFSLSTSPNARRDTPWRPIAPLSVNASSRIRCAATYGKSPLSADVEGSRLSVCGGNRDPDDGGAVLYSSRGHISKGASSRFVCLGNGEDPSNSRARSCWRSGNDLSQRGSDTELPTGRYNNARGSRQGGKEEDSWETLGSGHCRSSNPWHCGTATGASSLCCNSNWVVTSAGKSRSSGRRVCNVCASVDSSEDEGHAQVKREGSSEEGVGCFHGITVNVRGPGGTCYTGSRWRGGRAALSGTSSNMRSSRCSGARENGGSSATVAPKTFLGVIEEKGGYPVPISHAAVERDALVPLGKLCAERNLCSRREAEHFAALGLVSVNGKPVKMPRGSGSSGIEKPNALNTCNGAFNRISDSRGKFPVFFVRRDADVQLMPRAQRVMDSRLTVLLHKPLHYMTSKAERKEGHGTDKRLCRMLLTAERRWVGIEDGSSTCIAPVRGVTKEPRPPLCGSYSKMGCAEQLDSDSSGLVVFTQDGRIASLLGGRATAVGKEYIVEVDIPISAGAAELLRIGTLTLDGRALLPANVRLLPPVLCDASVACSTGQFFRQTPPAFLLEGPAFAVPPVHCSGNGGGGSLQGRENLVSAGGRPEGGDAAAPDTADQGQHENRSALVVVPGRETEEGEAFYQHGQDWSGKCAPLHGSVWDKKETVASQTASHIVHSDGLLLPRVTMEDTHERPEGRLDGIAWAGKTTRMAIELFEGRHKQIRRMCELVGLRVLRLHRFRIGKVYLGNLPAGRWRPLFPHERFV